MEGNMDFTQLALYFYGTVLVASAAAVVTLRNPVRSALFLILAFFSAACVWVTLEAEFLAIVLILVYVGAVMVLFLFIVMMLDINLDLLREGFTRYLPIGFLVALVMVVEIILVFSTNDFSVEQMPRPDPHMSDYSNVKELGGILYTTYVLPFELAALILLVAIIAAISLTHRRRSGTLHQNPADQVKVKSSDRLRVVKMTASAHVEQTEKSNGGEQ